MRILDEETRIILSKARGFYGYMNQVMVAVEECTELAGVCTKYPRYNTHDKAVDKLREKVIDEMADVVNVLDHLQHIFSITEEDIAIRARQKAERLDLWMHEGTTLEVSTEIREIPPSLGGKG